MKEAVKVASFKGKIYFLFFSLLLFFTPLIAFNNTNELYEFPKMYFVYLFGFFIIAYFLSDCILHPVKLKKPSPIVCAFFLITLISTVFSSHFYTSFFGYYTRFNDGLLSYIVFIGLYFTAINKLKKEDFERLLEIVVLTIIPISIYGLAQHFGGPQFLWNYAAVDRVFSTIGQPNWLAQYLVMLLLVCLYFSLSRSFEQFKFWFFIYILGFFCFWTTYSLSGILGFLAGVGLICVPYLKKGEHKNKLTSEKLGLRVALIVLISFSIVISNLGLFEAKINDVVTGIKKSISLVQKVYAQTSDYKVSDPGFIRLELWKSTFNLIDSSPKVFLIGSGPETFPYAFQKFRNLKLNYSSEWDYVFNKPHNYYLETWSESGIFALGIYLVLLHRLFKKTPHFLIPSIAAFAVTNFFGWPVVVTSLLFWFFLALVESWGEK